YRQYGGGNTIFRTTVIGHILVPVGQNVDNAVFGGHPYISVRVFVDFANGIVAQGRPIGGRMFEYFQFLGTDIHTVQAITVGTGPYFTTIVVEYADEQGSAFTLRAILGISLELLVDGIIGKEPF